MYTNFLSLHTTWRIVDGDEMQTTEPSV